MSRRYTEPAPVARYLQPFHADEAVSGHDHRTGEALMSVEVQAADAWVVGPFSGPTKQVKHAFQNIQTCWRRRRKTITVVKPPAKSAQVPGSGTATTSK